MKPVLRVERLSKQYRLGVRGHNRYQTMREAVMESVSDSWRWLRQVRGRQAAASAGPDVIWALRDVAFDVEAGEVVGIIGRNGAGKSTLLKILSRITDPTSGRVELRGRPGSLLEVGTGFHPELTGRENIYLSGAILGMSRRDLTRQLDAIIAFAEVDAFVDTPVKRYSSGMYLRLAFAVAAHLEPDILLVDEVLAVGDFAFQAKCLGRMGSLGQHGRTVLLVTHNLAILPQLCRRVILLDRGRVAADGAPRDVIAQYLQESSEGAWQWSRTAPVPARGVAITGARICSGGTPPGEELPSDEPGEIEITYEVRGSSIESRIVLEVETELGLVVFASTDCDASGGVDRPRAQGTYTCRCALPPNLLAPGTYYLTVAASCTRRVEWDRVPRALKLRVSRVGSLYLTDTRPGVIAPILSWEAGATA